MIRKKSLSLLILGVSLMSANANSGGPYDQVQYRQVTPAQPARPLPSAVIDPRTNLQDEIFLLQESRREQQARYEQELARIKRQSENEKRYMEQQKAQLEQSRIIAAQQAQLLAYNQMMQQRNTPVYNPPINTVPHYNQPAPVSYNNSRQVASSNLTVTNGSFGRNTVMRRIGVDGEGRPIFYFSPLPVYPLREVSSGVSNQVYGDGIRLRTTVISDARGTIYELTEPVGGGN
jgi:hypothetical protein